MAEDMSDTGALSSSGRFERMERALGRIEDKLDSKADASSVSRIEGELALLESQVESIVMEGTRPSRDAFQYATDNRRRIEALELFNLQTQFTREGKVNFLTSTRSIITFTISLAVGFSAALGILTFLTQILDISAR